MSQRCQVANSGMPAVLRFMRVWTALLGLFAAGALGGCGNSPDAKVRITLRGEQRGEPLEDLADLGNYKCDRALFRFARVTVASDTDSVSTTSALNVDLFNETIVIEAPFSGTPSRVTLELPQPTGDGVLRGEPVSVYAAGLLYSRPFEYRDLSMDPIEVQLVTPDGESDDNQSAEFRVRFELGDWFDDVDDAGLVETNGRYLIDSQHNPLAAEIIEAGMRASVGEAD